MTKYVVEKAMFFITNLYRSNIAKSTEQNNAEPYNTCDRHTFYDTFYLQITLVEIILPKIIRWGVRIRMSRVENF